jgi:hypothetical protein
MSPDRRKHRGPHPRDRDLFSETGAPSLRAAVADLSLLLSRGYPPVSSLKLVGDRYGLRERQRNAVSRSACADETLAGRVASRVTIEDARGVNLIIDGFNVIVSVEAALSGAVVLHCRDDAYRDLASVHGSYRRVAETHQAVVLIGDFVDRVEPAQTVWLLDRPVSNSGRLAAAIEEEAARRGASWVVRLVADPDPILKKATEPVATSDSAILDRCYRWLGLTRHVIDTYISDAWVIDLRPGGVTSN